MEKIMSALAKITLGGVLTFFFFYSLIVTIALIFFIAKSGDTNADIEQIQQINAQIEAASTKEAKRIKKAITNMM